MTKTQNLNYFNETYKNMINKQLMNIPTSLLPTQTLVIGSNWKPFLQEHLKLPIVFTHNWFTSHGSNLHSSISITNNK